MRALRNRIIGGGSIGRLVVVLTAVLLLGGTAVLADLNAGLVAYYPFNGNANDASGKGNDGTVVGATLVQDRLGNPNEAYYFGNEGRIDCGNGPAFQFGNSDFTLSAWVYYAPSSNLYDVMILSKDKCYFQNGEFRLAAFTQGSNKYVYFQIGDYLTGQGLWDPGNGYHLQAPLTGSTWVHVAVVRSGPTFTMFISGHLASIATGDFTQANAYDFMIGARYGCASDYGDYFPGMIDEVRVYSRALSEAEIQELLDSDGDGVPDASDQCPNTALGEVVNAAGCSISQLVPADGPWKNHGEYVSAVTHVASDFMAQGLITGAQKGAIVSAAARSDVGKKR